MTQFRQDLLRGSLDLMVLAVLADGPKYGYLIGQSLRQNSGDTVSVEAGTLYPLLHRLETQKLVRAKWEQETGRKRKWYELTTPGRKRLAQHAADWQAHAQCLQQLLTPILNLARDPNPRLQEGAC